MFLELYCNNNKMKKNNLLALASLLLLFSNLSFSQMEITIDTVYFQNIDKKVMVVHTTNRQYYNDSVCVWEVSYPEIFNLGNRIRETSINLMFS